MGMGDSKEGRDELKSSRPRGVREVDEDAEAVHFDDEFHPEFRESVAAWRRRGAALVELARVRPSKKYSSQLKD